MKKPDTPQAVPRIPTWSDDWFFETFGVAHQPPNAVTMWQSTDDVETWERNMADDHARRLILSCGWQADSVQYRYNNYGFRSDDDYDINSPLEGDMFLGCSWTDGVGINIEDTWGYMVSRRRGGAFYNLAQFGTGLDSQYRLLKAWGPILKPRAIFTLGSMENRMEIYRNQDKKPSHLGSWVLSNSDDEKQDLYLSIMSDQRNDLLNRIRAFDAIRWVARELNIPLYVPGNELVEEADWKDFTSGSIARDGMHPGKIFHQHMVDNLGRWQRV